MPVGTEVLHVYSTGLNGSLPHDMPAEQSSATFHLRGAYGPSLSQMFADQLLKGTCHGPPCGHMQSTLSFVDACLTMMAINAGVTSLRCLELGTLVVTYGRC